MAVLTGTITHRRLLEVQELTLWGGTPCLRLGHGPPLVVFRTAVPSSANPRGLERWAELRLLRPLARRFTVYAFDITVPTLVIAGSADEFYPSNWRGRSPNASATDACSSTRAETTAAC
jgi:hypothetical protein